MRNNKQFYVRGSFSLDVDLWVDATTEEEAKEKAKNWYPCEEDNHDDIYFEVVHSEVKMLESQSEVFGETYQEQVAREIATGVMAPSKALTVYLQLTQEELDELDAKVAAYKQEVTQCK